MSQEKSKAELFREFPLAEQKRILSKYTPEQLLALKYDWKFWGRPKQLQPFAPGNWDIATILAGRGFGKMLDLDTLIPTPEGFSPLRDLKVGDELFDEKGKICRVERLHPVTIPEKAYRVKFDDGTSIVACGDHDWFTWTIEDEREYHAKSYPEDWIVARNTKKSTEQIKETLQVNGKFNHAIPNALSIELPPVSEYSMDAFPRHFLRGSKEQRLRLLRKVLERSGKAYKNYYTVDSDCDLVQELSHSLGMKTVREDQQIRILADRSGRSRIITSVEEIPSVPMRCITVDSPNGAFLCGTQMVPTSNTRTGAEWILHKALTHPGSKLGIVAPTARDARAIMIQGPSGIETIAKPGVLSYKPALARIDFENGSRITVLTADEPSRIRGNGFHFAWIDEPQSWRYEEALDMLDFCMREGVHPQIIATMTPLPNEITYRLIDEKKVESGEILLISGSTFENQSNLADKFINKMVSVYEGTTLGEQELHAKVMRDIPGALFKSEWIKRFKNYDIETGLKFSEPEWVRTVVAIDLATTDKKTADHTVITVVSEAADGNFYVRDSIGLREVPSVWATKAVKTYFEYEANYIVIETNQGGQLALDAVTNVRSYTNNQGRIMHVRGDTLPLKEIKAHIGKRLRAEPVSMLYEKGRVTHMQNFAELEKQMRVFTGKPGKADDYVDSLVYALLELSNEPDASEYFSPLVGGQRDEIYSNLL